MKKKTWGGRKRRLKNGVLSIVTTIIGQGICFSECRHHRRRRRRRRREPSFRTNRLRCLFFRLSDRWLGVEKKERKHTHTQNKNINTAHYPRRDNDVVVVVVIFFVPDQLNTRGRAPISSTFMDGRLNETPVIIQYIDSYQAGA